MYHQTNSAPPALECITMGKGGSVSQASSPEGSSPRAASQGTPEEPGRLLGRLVSGAKVRRCKGCYARESACEPTDS